MGGDGAAVRLPGVLRPTNVRDVCAILFSLSVSDQVRARADAKRAIGRWGDDGEVTVYCGLRYRIPARVVKKMIDSWRTTHGWKSLRDVADAERRRRKS